MTRGNKTSTVIVARKADEFTGILKSAGLEVLNLPLIATEPVADLTALDEKLEILDSYDGVFLTSPEAAKIFVGAMEQTGGDFAGKIYALGERVRACFAGKNFNVVFREDANTAEQLIGSFDQAEFNGKRFLFLRGSRSMRTVPELLRGSAIVEEVEVYRTVDLDILEETRETIAGDVASGKIGWVCFFSPSAVKRYVELFGAAWSLKVAAIGTTTAQAAKGLGFNVELISEKASARDFASSLVEYLKN